MVDPPKPPDEARPEAPDEARHEARHGAPDGAWSSVELAFFESAPIDAPDVSEVAAEREHFDNLPPGGIVAARGNRRAAAARALVAASATGTSLVRLGRAAAGRLVAAAPGQLVAAVSARRLDKRGVAITVASAVLTLGLAAGVLPARNDGRITSPVATAGAPPAVAASTSVTAGAPAVEPSASALPAARRPGPRPSIDSQRQRPATSQTRRSPGPKLTAGAPARRHKEKEAAKPALARPSPQATTMDGSRRSPPALFSRPPPAPAPTSAERPLFSR